MSESTLNSPAFTLRFYPDPSLAWRCEAVSVFGAAAERLANDMFKAMRERGGIGLAANQMGQRERLFVVSGSILDDGKDLALFNPRMVERAGTSDIKEGCLSLPEVAYVVPGRALEARLEFQDGQGRHCGRVFKGLAAVCVQHELDHLDGLTMLDRLSALKSSRAKARLSKEAKAKT